MPGLDYYLIEVKDGRWFSATLPGWPAVLALGALLGLPWIVNPLLAGSRSCWPMTSPAAARGLRPGIWWRFFLAPRPGWPLPPGR
ncbi:MAG: hypothetical protein R3D46_04865 [Defluviimonas denitrificans]